MLPQGIDSVEGLALVAAGLVGCTTVEDLVVETRLEHTEGVVLGVLTAQEQWELGEDPQGYKAEETLDLVLVELEKHKMAADSLTSLQRLT